jgi:hypothetical protein
VQRKKWRATRSAKRGRVPAFKFGSMDGWRLAPQECRAIAKALGGLLEDDDAWSFFLDVLDMGPDDDEKSLRTTVRAFQAFNARNGTRAGYVVT